MDLSLWSIKTKNWSTDSLKKSHLNELVSMRFYRPKPLGHLMKFTQRSIVYCCTLHLDGISKFLYISAQEMFVKV